MPTLMYTSADARLSIAGKKGGRTLRVFLVVSFATVVAVVTVVCFAAVVMGAAAGDREAVVAGVALWSMMAALVVAGWGVLRLIGAGWSLLRRGR
jgi:hypothetical protein